MALKGNETLQVQGYDGAGNPSGETLSTTTGAIAALSEANVPVVTGIVANSAGTQTAATALTLGAFNNVTTVAGSGYGVKLPLSFVGATAVVSNQGANAAQIFGTSPDTINGVATATGISIPVGAIFVFTCAIAGNWLQNVQTGGAFTGTFDGVLGGNTPAAASVTTMTASGASSTTALTATATSNQVVLGTTRTLTLTAPTPASSSRTVTLPDPGGADSVTYLALAQTLTNKTLTAPTINGVVGGTTTSQTITTLTAGTVNGNTVTTGTGTLTLAASVTATGPATSGTLALINPPPVAVGSSLAITAAMSGAPILLNTASGSTATLPSATGSGNKYLFVVSVSATSAAHKILAGADSAYLVGVSMGYTGSTAKVFGSAASTNHSIQMPFAGSQPSGGIIGDYFEFTDIGSALWEVRSMYQAGTTPTTPFSSATT